MDTSTDEREWADPGTATSSFWNPAGPFRPLRRIVTWLTIAAIALAILGTIIGYGFAGIGVVRLAFVVALGIPTLLFVWGVLWFIDTILAYLKS